jgi:hypothetical protein
MRVFAPGIKASDNMKARLKKMKKDKRGITFNN